MDKYPNSKVGFKQDAETLFIDDDGYFNVDGQNVTGDQLRNALYAPLTIQRPITSNVSIYLADTSKNLTSGVGTVLFSVGSNGTALSFWLTSCTAGREVLLKVMHGSAAAASAAIWVSTSGCTLIGILSNISGFYLRSSAASCGQVKLKALEDDVWSVIDYNLSYAEA